MILDIGQHQKLAYIIEALEAGKVGTILLSGNVNLPVKSFALTPSKASFSMARTIESISVDELWTRISANLAYRKKSPGLIVRPAGPPEQIFHGNKLAEQLQAAESIVGTLAEQLRLAGLVQRDFLPSKMPDCKNLRWGTTFLPAEWVSGDLYDIVRLDEQHVAFYIVDAVGHSMPAALLTIFIKQALIMRESTEDNYRIFSPVEVMQNLNRRMTGQKLSGYQFATCCYCLLNAKTLQLTCARAGHPYPLILRKSKEPEPIQVRGSLLGIFEQAEFMQQTIQLQPGDRLLMYSDGAEPFIGTLDEENHFHFAECFAPLKNLPITEMLDKFNMLAQNQKIKPSEIDDVTAVGFEIL